MALSTPLFWLTPGSLDKAWIRLLTVCAPNERTQGSIKYLVALGFGSSSAASTSGSSIARGTGVANAITFATNHLFGLWLSADLNHARDSELSFGRVEAALPMSF